MIRIINIFLLLCVPFAVSAQDMLKSSSPNRFSEPIYFRIGQSDIDLGYEGNRTRMESLLFKLNQLLGDSSYIVNRVVVTGTTSPDGKEETNIALAGRRAKHLGDYLLKHTGVSPDKVEVVNGGENWPGLRTMIENSQMPYRSDMLSFMDQYPSDREKRKKEMQYFANSEPWLWMYEHFFPALRMGSGVSVYYGQSPVARVRDTAVLPSSSVAADTLLAAITPPPTDELEQVSVPARVKKKGNPFIAVKTDILLWSGIVPEFEIGTWTPNLSLEFYFARRWSVQGGCAYSNWNALSGSKSLYVISIADLEVRYWFGKPSIFKGLYVALFGQYGEYNVENDALTGNTGTIYAGGVGAGYLLPISRRLALELEIRGGYRSSEDEAYTIEPGHFYFNNGETVGKFFPQMRFQFMYRFGKTAK